MRDQSMGTLLVCFDFAVLGVTKSYDGVELNPASKRELSGHADNERLRCHQFKCFERIKVVVGMSLLLIVDLFVMLQRLHQSAP